MRYYLIAGEPSGDLHGSNLMKELKIIDPNAEFRFWGGDLMLEQSANIAKHYKETAFMGFVDVILNLQKIQKNFLFCHKDMVAFNPDVVVFIDYPGFNLRIAEFAKFKGYKTFYYISPKIWAWKTSRIKRIKKFVDRMFTILPFEKAFYQKYDYNVDYVGNPCVDAVEIFKKSAATKEAFLSRNHLSGDMPIIAILPGSRKQELKKCLAPMLRACENYIDYQIVIAGVSMFTKEDYMAMSGKENITVVYNQTYDLLTHAAVAVVTSGTAVLETALVKTPQVAVYRTNGLTFLFKPLLKIKYVTLPNIIMDKEIVKEVLQYNLEKRIGLELNKLLFDNDYNQQQQSDYNELANYLGTDNASRKTAKLIFEGL